MRVLGIDQSLAKCAFVLMEDGKPVDKSMAKTGSSGSKTKRKDVVYFDDIHSQIHFICNHLKVVLEEGDPDTVCFEALALGAAGNATRNLAMLLGAMVETVTNVKPYIDVVFISPTSLKTYARGFLKEEDQIERDTMGRPVRLKSKKFKVKKMDKKDMVKAVRELYGQDYLEGYNYSTGLDDLADATWLAHHTWKTYEKKETS